MLDRRREGAPGRPVVRFAEVMAGRGLSAVEGVAMSWEVAVTDDVSGLRVWVA